MTIRTFLSARLRLYLRNYLTRRRLRRQLQHLDAPALAALVSDLGISQGDLAAESGRPFWRSSQLEQARRERTEAMRSSVSSVSPPRTVNAA